MKIFRDTDWFRKLLIGGIISLMVSLSAYVLTSFASIDYVKDYVTIRHEQVKNDLERIEKKVDYLIELQINIKDKIKGEK